MVAGALAFAEECRAVTAIYDMAATEDKESVSGEIATLMRVAPQTGMVRLGVALGMTACPQLLLALEAGRLGAVHAQAVLDEISHLDTKHADAVLDVILGPHNPAAPVTDPLTKTPGELRDAVKAAIITRAPAAARERHERAKKTAGVRGRPGRDGMGQVVIDCTAVQMATALAAVKGRAAAMDVDDPHLTWGQKQVAALLHALGCERTNIQAILECPVETVADLAALAKAPVWAVDVRMPVAVALGLSDHPAVLRGFGPIDADQARLMLPAADLVRACVDATTGEVLTADAPIRQKTWSATTTTDAEDGSKRGRNRNGSATSSPELAGSNASTGGEGAGGGADRGGGVDGTGPSSRRSLARALRETLIAMATTGGTIPDLTTDGYVPSEALGRLVDVRDVTSVFPGDRTSTRHTDRDHRLPHPLGPTSARNIQNAARHWHRAKHGNWQTHLLADGTIRWTSPHGHIYDRAPRRTRPPNIPPNGTLPPLED